LRYTVSDYTVEQIGRQDVRSINISVVGYWSRDVITVYMNRQLMSGWNFSISYSSGGRDPKVEPDDCVAVRNFAEGLVRASLIVEEMRAQEQDLEYYYQQYRDELAKEAAAERAAQQTLIDADPALDAHKVKQIIKTLTERGGTFMVYRRAGDNEYPLTAERTWANKTYFYANGLKTSRAHVNELLLQSSARSYWNS
jgi:hypothetical protein